jgi:hypothetical protein
MGADIKSLAMSVLRKPGVASIQSQPFTVDETPTRLPEGAQSQAVSWDHSQLDQGLPTKRCRACKGWLYWVSIHGPVICAGCHAPASRALVRTWYWLPEGEAKNVQ